MLGEIAYPFGAAVEVGEWISNFIPHLTGHINEIDIIPLWTTISLQFNFYHVEKCLSELLSIDACTKYWTHAKLKHVHVSLCESMLTHPKKKLRVIKLKLTYFFLHKETYFKCSLCILTKFVLELLSNLEKYILNDLFQNWDCFVSLRINNIMKSWFEKPICKIWQFCAIMLINLPKE